MTAFLARLEIALYWEISARKLGIIAAVQRSETRNYKKKTKDKQKEINFDVGCNVRGVFAFQQGLYCLLFTLHCLL